MKGSRWKDETSIRRWSEPPRLLRRWGKIVTETTQSQAVTCTTCTGPYAVHGHIPEIERAYEYTVSHRDTGYFESGMGALRLHAAGYGTLSREIIFGNHLGTTWPVFWPVGLKIVEMTPANLIRDDVLKLAAVTPYGSFRSCLKRP
jgi:hypothetical protein